MDTKQELEKIMNEDLTSVVSSLPPAVLIVVSLALATTLGVAYYFESTAKLDKQLSSRIKNILKDGKDWKVMIVKSKTENAFCMGLPIIFLTSAFVKNNKNNPRLIEGIMLHEASHIKNYDTLKMALSTLPGQSLFVAILLSNTTGPAVGFFLFLAYVLVIISGVFYGRKAETRADNLAIKYGYGQDIKEFFEKIKKKEDAIRNKVPDHPAYKKTYEALNRLGQMLDVHPKIEERIKNALDGSKLYNIVKTSKNIKDLSMKIYKMLKT